MVPTAVWKEMVIAVNRNLVAGTTVTTKKDPRRKPTTVVELQRFYGIILIMENSYSNDTHNLRLHLKVLKQRYADSWPSKMGTDRFQALIRFYITLQM